MSNLAQNVRAIEVTIRNFEGEVRDGRNNFIRRYHRPLDKSVKDSLIYGHGSAVYRSRNLEEFFNLINKRPVHLPVHFLGGDDNAFLAMAANDLSNMVYARAMRFWDTGRHANSLTLFIREVGGRASIHLDSGKVAEGMLPDRAVISVVALTEYANTLEAHFFRSTEGAILHHVAREFQAKYRRRLAVKYDYVSGTRIGERGGTFPRIQIGLYGNLRPMIKRPGQSIRRP